MKIYLGGPINGCTDEEASGWRDEAKVLIEAAGHEAIDPMDRDYRGREMEPGIAAEIVEKDKEDIRNSDVLLMNAPKPSYGTAMEILFGYYAHDERGIKKIVVVLPDDGKDPSPWIVYHASEVVRGSVVDALRRIL